MTTSRSGLTAFLLLAGALVLSACGGGGGTGSLDDQLSVALLAADVAPLPAAEAESEDLVELGRMLFFDPILSGNRNIACSTCHHPVAATGDALCVSIGEGGTGLAETRHLDDAVLIPRNAPGVFNLGLDGMDVMFWDGRVRFDPAAGTFQTPDPGLNGPTPALQDVVEALDGALAAQAMFPVTSQDEMRGRLGTNEIADAGSNAEMWRRLMLRLGEIPAYRTMFAAAFPDAASFEELNFGHAARAIAAYERAVFTMPDSPFDRYLRGETDALSDAEKRGALLFYGTAGCATCHEGSLLTDQAFHALCVPQLGPGKLEPSEDRGRELVTNDPGDRYRFRTPPLRNVALTGPWMHDGAFTTLDRAVRHVLEPRTGLVAYDVTQLPALFRDTVDEDPYRNALRADLLDPALRDRVPLTDEEVGDLLDFLNALTDPDALFLLADIPASVPSGLPMD